MLHITARPKRISVDTQCRRDEGGGDVSNAGAGVETEMKLLLVRAPTVIEGNSFCLDLFFSVMIGLALGAMPCTQGLQLVWQEAIGSPNSGLLQPWRWPPKAARRQPQRWHAQGELKRLGSEGAV